MVVLGILVSVPIIVWGSKFVLKLMDRFQVVITFGGGLLGWIAGEMLISDHVLTRYFHLFSSWFHYASSLAGAVLVVVVGTVLATKGESPNSPPVLEQERVDDSLPL